MKYTTYFLALIFLVIYAFVQKPAPLFYLMIKKNNLSASAKLIGIKKIKLLYTQKKYMIKIESSASVINGTSVNLNDKMFWVSFINNKVTAIEDYAEPNTNLNFTNTNNCNLPKFETTLVERKTEKSKNNPTILFWVLKENMEYAMANKLIEANTDLENRKTGIQTLLIHSIIQ